MKTKNIYMFVEKISETIIPLKCRPFLRPFKQKMMPADYKKLSCTWFVTWSCNFHCPYCWQLEEPGVYREKYNFISEDWLSAWKRISKDFDGVVIGVSGGEPFLLKGFIPLLNSLPENIRYEITSNLSFNVDDFLSFENIRKRCLGVVCSFHPSNLERNGNYIECFFDKVKKLTALRYTRVNFVAAPSNLKFYDRIRDFCDENRIGLHVDRYVSLREGMLFTAEESEFAEKIIASDRKQSLGRKQVVLCSGGNTHIALLPDGSIYPCLKKAELREDLVGNIFHARVHLNDKWLQCSYYPSCRGCDWDNISVMPCADFS